MIEKPSSEIVPNIDSRCEGMPRRAIVRSAPGFGAGRRPEGFALRDVQAGTSTLAAFLSISAELEAASAPAYERLADELQAHGAPAALVTRALAARDDELRHAQAMAALARAHGVEPSLPTLSAQPVRTLTEVALENAREGCVRETFAALVAIHQATAARDLELRRAMGRIAADELRHAALAHAVDAWLGEQLDDDARQRVAAAKEEAIAELRQELLTGSDDLLRMRAGLPRLDVALGMLDDLTRKSWALLSTGTRS